jgi:orotidine-5'-phosphate decarboxylase
VNPLLVALDFPSATEAVRMAIRLVDVVGGFKIGLQLLSGPGPGTVLAIRELGKPVFVDAKLHDIPNTVESAARRLGALGARWVTVHASGGEVMMAAAVNGLASGADAGPAGILAVTVLTSLDTSSLARTGVTGSPGRQVSRLSRLAGEAGAEGVVCSVRELGDVAQVAAGLLRVTPGIRPAGADFDDQSRVSTPSEAIRRGADYVVVGRPITRAADPLAAAAAISEEITSARI